MPSKLSFGAGKILQLQQQAGNCAVSSLLTRCSRDSPVGLLMPDMPVACRGPERSLILQRRPTNYRFDTYRITKADLSDPDIVERLQGLSPPWLLRYWVRVADGGVRDFIGPILDKKLERLAVDDVSAMMRDESDPRALAYLRAWLDAHVPTSFEIALGTGTAGSMPKNMKVWGISVFVAPDETVDQATFDSLKSLSPDASSSSRAITIVDPKWHPRWVTVGANVKSVKPTTQTLRLKTVYLAGTSRYSRSAYGVGTETDAVTSGRSTIAHHEGAHVSCFIDFLRANKPPVFTGKVGDSKSAIEAKGAAFNTAMIAYYGRSKERCGHPIDCVGKAASFCRP